MAFLSRRSLVVDAPVVLGTSGQALLLFTLDTGVDWHHAHGFGLHAGLLQVGPSPVIGRRFDAGLLEQILVVVEGVRSEADRYA